MANGLPVVRSGPTGGRLRQLAEGTRDLPLALLCGLAAVVGCLAGLGAVALRDLIGFIHNLLFLGKLSLDYNASLFTPSSPWGPIIFFVPVLGSLGVTFIVRRIAPEAKGSSVPRVMAAIYYQSGVIRPTEGDAKSLASALAIGSGAAVGREGPVVQIGAALAGCSLDCGHAGQSGRIGDAFVGLDIFFLATAQVPLGRIGEPEEIAEAVPGQRRRSGS